MGEHKLVKPARPVAEITIVMDSNGVADIRAFDLSGSRIQGGIILPGRAKMHPMNCAAMLSQVLSGIMVSIMTNMGRTPPEGNSNGDENKTA